MTTIDKTAACYAKRRTAALRELLRAEFGPRKYRLTKSGDVHAYGVMPNSIETGWYLIGSRREVETEYCL